MSLIVKILNGPHEGAQMEIPKEGLVLGSDDSCDLIIFDSKIAPHHLRLIPQDTGFVILSPLEGEVSVDGVLVQQDSLLESPAQVITAGDTHLVAGSADQEWPEIQIPKEQQMAVELSASSFEEPKTREKKGSLRKMFIGGSLLFLLVYGAYFSYEVIAKKSKKPVALKAKSGSYFQQVSQFVKELFPEKITSSKSRPTSPRTTSLSELSVPIDVRVARQLLKGVPQVFFSVRGEDRRKKFDIWMRGEEASAKARQILDRVAPPLLYSIIDLSQMEASAVTLARLFGLNVSVHIDPEGIAFWSGYLRDEKSWCNFFPHASKELPGIRDNRCEVAFGNRLLSKLRAALQQQGFDNKVRPIADETGMRLEGFLPPEQRKNWDSWLVEMRDTYRVSIIDKTNSNSKLTNPSLKEFFPAQVVGISGNILPWVTLANGWKLFPGAKLKKGYTLETITADSLRVTGPDGTLDFSLSLMN